MTASVVFAVEQLNIQYYNDNFGLQPKIVMETLQLLSLSLYKNINL